MNDDEKLNFMASMRPGRIRPGKFPGLAVNPPGRVKLQ